MSEGVAAQMPRYRCHKEVWALKIRAVQVETEGDRTTYWIVPEEEGFARFEVPHAYIVKHDPQAGGYYVVYEDGYKSFSPAAPFEAGYTRI